MSSTIYNFVFVFASIWILLKTIGFALYEINSLGNKSGGYVTIGVSILVVIFFNIMIFLH